MEFPFEAARISTAMINGCKICMNWQSKRDVHQMGIVGGVTNNGEAPDDSFYSNLLNNNLKILRKNHINLERLIGRSAHLLNLERLIGISAHLILDGQICLCYG